MCDGRSALEAALAALAAAGGDATAADRAVTALAGALGLQPESRPLAAASGGGLRPGRARVVGRWASLHAVHVRLRRLRPGAAARAARWLRGRLPGALHLFLLTETSGERLGVVLFDPAGRLRQLTLESGRPRGSDLDALERMIARPGESGVELLLRCVRALDRGRLRRRFFHDFRAHRSRIADAWSGLPAERTAERERLALLLLCRLMFLRFLQDRGRLAGDPGYLARLATLRRRPGSLFRRVLQPLFFGALNTRPERRGPDTRRLGALPYLNGGLFERHALERRFPALDLPDGALGAVLTGLLDRYRFTPRDSGEGVTRDGAELGIDPEMLGRVFEELMEPEQRGGTGTFYTPAPAVASLVAEAVAAYLGVRDPRAAAALPTARRRRLARAVQAMKVLDPACGSGAFLLGAMARLARLRWALDGTPAAGARRDLVARCLYGVDVQPDAALLCSLRLWLALALPAPGEPPPLPNLDRRIRQGDSLLAPLDLARVAGREHAVAADVAVRRALSAVATLGETYVGSGPERRSGLRRRLAAAEARLARTWIEATDRARRQVERELRAQALGRDLFGDIPPSALRARAALHALAEEARGVDELRSAASESRALPFFSFPIHFPEAAAGFDLILSNPPWVRSRHWPRALSGRLRRRYAESVRGWRRGARLSGGSAGAGAQADLAVLFLQRCVELLAPGGVVALLVPAKVLRSLYGAGARRLLLQRAELLTLHDHALDQHAVFRADAFTAAVVARRPGAALEVGGEPLGADDADAAGRDPRAPRATPDVRVRLTRPGVPDLDVRVPSRELPVLPDDVESPWLLAPTPVLAALRRMQRSGPLLGERHRIRRGVVTGANDVLLLRSVEPKLGGLAWVRPEGSSGRRGRRLLETAALAPLVRGSGIDAWSYRADDHVVWLRDASGGHVPPPRRLARYLATHAPRLTGRSGAATAPPGAVFRVSADTLRPKVAWHDLADTLKAVALPATVRACWGEDRPLIPLNTTYFIAVGRDEDALLLSAVLNSLAARTFVRTVAERAKDARFRFLGWTVALLPLPAGLSAAATRTRLTALARDAHRGGALSAERGEELDARVAEAYGLTPADTEALASFDRWLRGIAP